MRKHKYVENGYILMICEGDDWDGIEISDEEYNAIMAAIQARPTPPEGFDYILREDMSWELIALPPMPEPDPEEEISGDEALEIILGGEI